MIMVERRNYDKLVRYFSEWMENNWVDFDRQWSLKGCRVEGTEEKMDELWTLIRFVRFID